MSVNLCSLNFSSALLSSRLFILFFEETELVDYEDLSFFSD